METLLPFFRRRFGGVPGDFKPFPPLRISFLQQNMIPQSKFALGAWQGAPVLMLRVDAQSTIKSLDLSPTVHEHLS